MILDRYKRFVLWGLRGEAGGDSFRHVHRHYQHALTKLGKEVVWWHDEGDTRALLEPGDLVFAVDIASNWLGYQVPGVTYILHNFDSSNIIWEHLDPERTLRLQVYTNSCEIWGEEWEPGRRFDKEGRTLFQPWGTDLLAEEFHPPIFEGRSDEVPFVGSIWDSDGQGNVAAINELKEISAAHRLTFRHYRNIDDATNVSVVRRARLAPAVTGRWQVENDYLPCRVFKNVSYGALALTNVPKFRELFDGCFTSFGSVSRIFTDAMQLSEQEYLELVAAQQEVVKRFTYRESLLSIERALEEGM